MGPFSCLHFIMYLPVSVKLLLSGCWNGKLASTLDYLWAALLLSHTDDCKSHFQVTLLKKKKAIQSYRSVVVEHIECNNSLWYWFWWRGSGYGFRQACLCLYGSCWIKQYRWVNWQAADKLASSTELLNRASQSTFCLPLFPVVQFQQSAAQHHLIKWDYTL